MKYPPKKVFILENGEYFEISFEERIFLYDSLFSYLSTRLSDEFL